MHPNLKSIGKSFLKTLCVFLLFIVIALAISMLLGLAVGAVSYRVRDRELIAAICGNSYSTYSFVAYFLEFTMDFAFIGFAVSAVILRKFLFKGVGFVFLPLVVVIEVMMFLISLFSWTGAETQCMYSPLIDTEHSETFNPYNVPKVRTGMTREEVIQLIGEPLYERENTMHFTDDGACSFGDFAWYELWIDFEDGKASEIYSDWMDD